MAAVSPAPARHADCEGVAKVVTSNGVITLRGPVKSDAEKKSVEAKAFAAAGSDRVDDQLDAQSN